MSHAALFLNTKCIELSERSDYMQLSSFKVFFISNTIKGKVHLKIIIFFLN